MPKPLIIPITTQTVEWSTLRLALKNCIEAVAPNARVYSSWPLKYDIGETISLLKSDAENGRVHAWMISISEAEPIDRKAGGRNLEWILNVRIWGFLGYQMTHDDATQTELENEAKKVAQIIYLNDKHLGMDDTQGLKKVDMLVFDDIDVHAFGSGSDVHVAQGNLTITISETFQVAL